VLCLGGVATLSAMALVAIAAATDHWTATTVDRQLVTENSKQHSQLFRYYSRTDGLFRTCFPENRFEEGVLHLSPIEEWCTYKDYHLSSLLAGSWSPSNMSLLAVQHLQLVRATPLLLLAYMGCMALVGLVGLAGCWTQSSNRLITTAALQLLAAVAGAASMATWHAALFLEMEKLHDKGFPLSWADWLQRATRVDTDWSYFVAWAGICLTLVASLLTSSAAICLRSQRRQWEDHAAMMKLKMSSMFAHHAYFPPDYAVTPLPTYKGHSNLSYPAGGRSMMGSRATSMDDLDSERVQDFKKVLSEMEKSRF